MHMIPDSQSPPVLDTPVSAAMNRMARFLKTMRPATDAEALRMLRAVFPQATLVERTAALARHNRRTLAPIS
jgi:hypothetical protein